MTPFRIGFMRPEHNHNHRGTDPPSDPHAGRRVVDAVRERTASTTVPRSATHSTGSRHLRVPYPESRAPRPPLSPFASVWTILGGAPRSRSRVASTRFGIWYAVRVSSSRLGVVPSSDLDTFAVAAAACPQSLVSSRSSPPTPVMQSLFPFFPLSYGPPSRLCLPVCVCVRRRSVSVPRMGFEYMIIVSTIRALQLSVHTCFVRRASAANGRWPKACAHQWVPSVLEISYSIG